MKTHTDTRGRGSEVATNGRIRLGEGDCVAVSIGPVSTVEVMETSVS